MAKYAIVTGASTGIGRAIAIELGKAGFHVGLVARSKEKLVETKRLVESVRSKAAVFPLDLRNINAIQRLAKTLETQWGRIDILVNVAGVYHDKTKAHYNIPFTQYTMNEIKNTYGECFYRMWKFYLLSFAGLFRDRHFQLWQVVFSKGGTEGVYRSVR